MTTSLIAAPCWALFGIVCAIAWPIWHHAKEYALFRRRAMIATLALDDSAVRRWFWSGNLSGVLHAFGALLWAVLLLAFGVLLSAPQWVLLAADAVVFAALIPFVRRGLAREIRATHVAMVARRWPLLLGNVALLSLGFFVIDFYIAGAPDTRGFAWLAVAGNAYTAYAGKSACAIAGVVIGTASVVDALAWHAAQVLIPALPQPALKLAAWIVVLLRAGVVAWAFTRLLLGASALIETAVSGVAPERARPRWPTDFIFAVIVAAVTLLLLAAALRDFDPATMPRSVRNAVAWANPCRSEARSLGAMQPALRAEVERTRGEASAEAGRRVDATVTTLFANAEPGVDRYLDWYFSLLGEYQRLGGALVTGDVSQLLRAELERRVFGERDVEAILEDATRSIAGDSVARFEALVADVGAALLQSARVKPCLPDAIDVVALRALDRDRFRASVAATGGVAMAIGARALAARAASAMAARVAAQQTFRAAASVGGKVAARRAGTITLAAAAASACAPGGPLAALCALIAGAVSWIAIDEALIKIDELRMRDEMRAEILESVRTVEQELAADLKTQHQAMIDELASGVAASVDRVFVPARQGL